MKGKTLQVIGILSVMSWLSLSLPLFAYEVQTHRNISAQAARQSILSEYLPEIGIDSIDEPIETDYLGSEPRSSLFWIQFGAEAEDETFSDGLSIARYLNHFFNPLTGAGLFYQPPFLSPCVTVHGLPAPDWGLKEGQAASANQIFSFKDARDYFYKGLTEQNKNLRGQYFAMTFRTLGQVIHLIQDMAQPQHTRNDPHGPLDCYGGKSLYEFYTDSIDVRPSLPYNIAGSEAAYGDADTSTFNTPRNFWTTSEGKGLADYSNRGFVSAGTNFDKPDLFPAPLLDSAWDEDKSAFCAQINLPHPRGPDGTELPCVMSFIRTFVEDRYQSTLSGMNNRASTYSIFSADLTKYNTAPYKLYTLNSFNFKDAHQFLIPRAVAYSAGLINYFFRGKLEFEPDPSNPNQYLIKNLGAEDMQGTFTLYYDDANDNRWEVPEARWSVAVAKGSQAAVPTFAPPTNPAPKTPGEYLLVFKGQMGEEQPVSGPVGAVVAKKVPPSAPFLLTTSTGVYKSGNFDQGWVKISNYGFDIFAGYYIRPDLMFQANGTVWRSVDGGINYDNVEEGTDYRIADLTYLGGTELLFDACPLVYSVCGTLYSPDLGATLEFRPFDDTVRFTSTLRYVGNGTVLRVGIPYTTGEGWMLYKSADKGVSWTRVPSAAGVNGTDAYDQWDVYNLWWNQVEGEGSVVFAAGALVFSFTDSIYGLWKSTDGGTTWRLVWSFGGMSYDQVWSLAIDPQGQALMVMNHGYSDFFLYKSRDAGETWEQIEAPDGSTPYGVMDLRNNLGIQ